MFSALHGCLARISHEALKKVVHIAICGQMHGIMFWKNDSAWIRNEHSNQQVSTKYVLQLQGDPYGYGGF